MAFVQNCACSEVKPPRRLQNTARMGAAPILLDRSEVLAYADRLMRAVEGLDKAISARWGNGSVADRAKPNALPADYYYDFKSFVANYREFRDSINEFTLFGPVVWSVWQEIEGHETQYRKYKDTFVTKYGGKVETTDMVTPSDINKEHPSTWNVFGSTNMAVVGIAVGVVGVLVLTNYLKK